MNINIIRCHKEHFDALTDIWEHSVRATHDFLSETDICSIRLTLATDYFPNVDIYGITEDEILVGFIGIRDDMIEMLFIDNFYFGKGYGSLLIEHALRKGAIKVDVNEQNKSALMFYRAKGFNITGKDETDEAGRPYPILHLSL